MLHQTCDRCKNKRKRQIEVNRFINYYTRLPIAKLDSKQQDDIRIGAILALSHHIEFEPQFYRNGGNLTHCNQQEYAIGVNPALGYVPDDCAALCFLKKKAMCHVGHHV